jgi:hypothetical protein
VDYLLDHTTAHRIEALANDASTGEQKAPRTARIPAGRTHARKVSTGFGAVLATDGNRKATDGAAYPA